MFRRRPSAGLTDGSDGGEKAPVLVLLALLTHSRFWKGRTDDGPSGCARSSATPVEVVDVNIGSRIRRGQRSPPTVNHRSRGGSFVW